MQAFNKYLRVLLAVALLLIITIPALAGDEHYAAEPLDGSKGQVKTDSSTTVQDTVTLNTLYAGTAYRIKNLVTFSINEYSLMKLPDVFRAKVQIKIYATRWNGSNYVMDSSVTAELTVNYDKDNHYARRSAFTFDGACQVKIKILGITSEIGALTDYDSVLMLENEILVNRAYAFDCSNSAVLSVSKDTSDVSGSGELKVSWAKERTADEYDLEWTFVDDSAIANYKTSGNPDPKKIFTNNATRVSITKEDYTIPLLYDNSGTLYFRVRSVQVDNTGQRKESRWSSDYSGGLGSYVFNGHERTLNWQATTSYAEEGKRKSVVQYYDGSLRSRQTVTKDNTTDTTLVAETMYDYQGRPVIQVLPAPSLSRLIQYTPNFSVDINNAEYDKSKYDGPASTFNYCGTGAAQMGTQSGAAKYYSSANQNVNNSYHQYIPDAHGYPFTETKYTQDNTGRISSQGGVDTFYQIGRGKETKYYYGSADQEDIDGLFGSSAGNANHYFKNMVRDANGQYSVSYVDMHGRTVATALAGKPEAQLDSLESGRLIYITKKLVDSTNNIIKGLVIESSKSLVVTKAGVHSFHYSLATDSLRLAACDSTPVCYDCLYNLQITITDDCNNQTLPGGQPVVIADSNFTIGHITATCDTLVGFDKQFTDTLQEGTYTITKRLTISKYGMDYYRDSIFLARNTCRSLSDFIAEQQQILQGQIDCAPSCAHCSIDTFTSWTLYRPWYLNQLGIAAADTAGFRNQALIAYNSQREACDNVCGTTPISTYIRHQMLADVTPPYGQYANPGDLDLYSVFNTNNISGKSYNNLGYTNEQGNADIVFLADGSSNAPGALGITDFVANFKSTWADSLLTLHPEYRKLLVYESNPPFAASHAWDSRFEAINTYKQARDSGFLNPLGYTDAPVSASSTIRDPFFNSTNNPEYASAWRTVLNDSMRHKGSTDVPGYIDMWSLATAMAQCTPGDNTCYDYYKTNAHPFDIDTACGGTLDMAWRYFRQMYLDEKKEIITRILDLAAPTPWADLMGSGHQLNFPELSVLLTEIPTSQQAGTDSLNSMVSSSCRGYVLQWLQDLGPCNYTDDDTTVLIPRLVKVCQEGGDITHPFGSSSVKPSSTYAYKTFDEVLKAYNDSLALLPTPRIISRAQCNGYLLSAPGPYDNGPAYSNIDIWSKPDSCQCSTITALYNQYLSYGTTDASFAAYLLRTTGTSMSGNALDSLRQLCNGTITCKALKNPILLPPVLQCGVHDVCVNCLQVNDAYNQYTTAFPAAIPMYDNTDSLQRSYNQLFANFMNNKLGFGMQASDYLSFMDSCKIGQLDTTTLTCNQLNDLLNEYRNTYINPVSGYVDLDMRTFSGNKTPAEGPKGVFDVNGNLIGNTIDSTVALVNASFVQIWNSSTANQAVGSLSLLQNGKFRLQLNPGMPAPCDGIIGMRYYQFETAADTIDAILTGTNCYADFGDGIKKRLQVSNSDSTTYILDHSIYGVAAPTLDTMFRHLVTIHRFAISGTKTITVYHPDVRGYLGFNNSYPSAKNLGGLKNLRGYMPQETKLFAFFSTQDTTFNTTSRLRNFNQVTSIESIYFANGSPGDITTDFKNNRFESFIHNTHLKVASLDNNLSAGLVDSSRRPVDEFLPDIKNNFKELSSIRIAGTSGQFTDNINLRLSHIGVVYLRGDLLPYQIDSVINQVAATTLDSGYMAFVANSFNRTPASDAAVATLTAKHWYLQGAGLNVTNTVSAFPFVLNIDSAMVTSAFTEFINSRLGTTMSWNQVNDLYKEKCDSFPNYCSPAHVTGPTLCGKSEPVFPPVTLTSHSPCDDSTNITTTVGTLRYQSYRDSLNNTFNDKYLAKCLNAYKLESFTVTQPMSEFHYTLYYYDQAGNLARTVPPAGVDMSVFSRSTYFDSVRTARQNGTVYGPGHTLPTDYRYNTLNQVVAQHTPDAGNSAFWYDRLGRLAISQNAKQYAVSANENNRQYSYTKYDWLGRITEVGQVNNAASSATSMADSISRNQALLRKWLDTTLVNRNEQITRTFYDLPYSASDIIPMSQKNLRNRVSYTSFTQNTDSAFNQATFYSYDIHGNVDTLLQDYGSSSGAATQNIMNKNFNRWKRIQYNYDLISGKVNMVSYQPRYWDAVAGQFITPYDCFYHRYTYDAENRLTLVETSQDSILWEKDARYEYYKHGPLARTVLGEQQVQGLDYAYTLQGWLKGMNGTSLRPQYDMGLDGLAGGQRSKIARDVFAYSLNYFGLDYSPISGNTTLFPGYSAYLNSDYRPLYNGNISSMAVNIKQFAEPTFYNYKYDQLNRIKGVDVWLGFNEDSSKYNSSFAYTQAWKERFKYDGNGNIQHTDRYNVFATVPMDSMDYHYAAGTNKLTHITEASTSYDWINGTNDIETQPVNNYGYDAIGNLVRDSSENIGTDGITWNVYGKITSISRSTATATNNTKRIEYTYDAAGNRIGQKLVRFGSARVDYTWYVRDAQGNVLNVYTAGRDTSDSPPLQDFDLLLMESHLYGSSRLGVQKRNVTAEPPSPQGSYYGYYRGDKFYEISNHLGNVVTTISDKKFGVLDSSTSLTQYAWYNPEIVMANDYYVFGMERKHYDAGIYFYRYGFNGKENDRDVKGEGAQYDYGFRIYDPRISRFLSVDPLTPSYPWYTPYQFAGNKPTLFIDIDGLEEAKYPVITGGWGGQVTIERKDAQQVKDYQKGLKNGAAAGAVVALVAADLYFTKGKVTASLMSTLGISSFLGAFEHNRAKTEEGRKDQDNRTKEALAGTALWEGGGVIGGKSLKAVSILTRLIEEGGQAVYKYFSSASVRFSQTTVNGVEAIESSMKVVGWKGDPIDIVKMEDGIYTTVDNTRLVAAQRAGIDVKANAHGFDDVIPEEMATRFAAKDGTLPKTWGEAVKNRIANQGKSLSAKPNGSFVQPKINKW